MLHGHPRTHATWHPVADPLASDLFVVCPDLRGYGRSSKPPTTPDHEPYSKRAMARDMVALMRALGHDRFAVAGHDRAHDEEDRARGVTIDCPTLVLWPSRDDLGELYGDPVAVWRPWAPGARGGVIDSGHHMAEEAPEPLAGELRSLVLG